MKMHNKGEESIIPDEEHKSWEQKWSEEDEKLKIWVFGLREERSYREKLKEKWIWNREVRIYTNFIIFDRSRAIEA